MCRSLSHIITQKRKRILRRDAPQNDTGDPEVFRVILSGYCYSLFVILSSIFYKEHVKTRYKRKYDVFLLIVCEIVTMF